MANRWRHTPTIEITYILFRGGKESKAVNAVSEFNILKKQLQIKISDLEATFTEKLKEKFTAIIKKPLIIASPFKPSELQIPLCKFKEK